MATGDADTVASMKNEPSFPWDKLKAETLRSIGRDLGFGGSGKRGDMVAFFQNVERHGFQQALKHAEAQDRETERKKVKEGSGNGDLHLKRSREQEPEPLSNVHGPARPGSSHARQGHVASSEDASPRPAKRRARGLQMEVVLPRLSDLSLPQRRETGVGSKGSRGAPKKASKGKGKQKEGEETTEETDLAGSSTFTHQPEPAMSPLPPSDSPENLLKGLQFVVETDPHFPFSFAKWLSLTIRTPEGQNIGEMEVMLIYRTKAIKDCGSLFDALEDLELDEFAGQLFDPLHDGQLQEHLDITEYWPLDGFAGEATLVYVHKIRVEDVWRRRGVGTWAYGRLQSLPQCKKAHYMFVRPALAEPETPAEERSVYFHRKVGFRRIGNSAYFAWAKDPRHPSRAIPPSEDCHYDDFEPSDQSDFEWIERLVGIFANKEQPVGRG